MRIIANRHHVILPAYYYESIPRNNRVYSPFKMLALSTRRSCPVFGKML